jgi:hypothetical protein
LAGVQEALDGVGDLQFPSPGRGEPGNGLVDGGREDIHAHQGQVGGGLGRLFHQAHQAALAVHFGNAELGRVFHFLKQNQGVQVFLLKRLQKGADAALNQVVA